MRRYPMYGWDGKRVSSQGTLECDECGKRLLFSTHEMWQIRYGLGSNGWRNVGTRDKHRILCSDCAEHVNEAGGKPT